MDNVADLKKFRADWSKLRHHLNYTIRLIVWTGTSVEWIGPYVTAEPYKAKPNELVLLLSSSHDDSATNERKDKPEIVHKFCNKTWDDSKKQSTLCCLPASTIKLLSSGQVITSVSTAVKELVENAIDAGASNIEITLENEGYEKIEVKDNGKGIRSEDVPYMCQCRYTSKIRDFGDLDHLESYGFRGEGLSSLCTLSQVTVTTKTKRDDLAKTYSFDSNGNVISSRISHLNLGTIITVQGLFKNLPVRKQFLTSGKRKTQELNSVANIVKSFGLIHPSLRIVLHHNKFRIWQKSAVSSVQECLVQVIPHTVSKNLYEINHSEGNIRSVAFNNDPCIKEFGIFVDTNFTNVEARILDAPRLLYKQSERSVDKGVWKSGRFLKADPLSRWAILNTDRRVGMNKLQDLFSSLQRNGKELGMEIDNPIIVVAERPNEVENHFKAWKDKGIQLAVIILPDRGITYAKVKQIAEQQVGVLTQCLKSRTLEKLSPSTVTNILLKINSKHNGINHNIKCSVWEKYFNRPVIVFGADVAASYEPKAFAYNMEWRFQPPREEMICDLEEIVKKQLLEFYNRTNGLKPEKIFFYRDGVSEGQFKKVLDVELQAIRRACKGLGGEYQPSITFLVVQKRHHTRFFPQAKDADGRNKNVPAGTVVDTTITHINEIDFYLVSHASIQGTSRPTKYHVLWDDSNMSEDDIEELTYYLCHLFTRCTRAVSYPAPTYYAHLAAFRIRSYYEDQAINLNSLKKEESKMKVVSLRAITWSVYSCAFKSLSFCLITLEVFLLAFFRHSNGNSELVQLKQMAGLMTFYPVKHILTPSATVLNSSKTQLNTFDTGVLPAKLFINRSPSEIDVNHLS
uniref:Piwi domain-containing protein n=1 Tax=Rhodnius prolixus TaxID=13249 RepID=T1I3W2_RHOPR